MTSIPAADRTHPMAKRLITHAVSAFSSRGAAVVLATVLAVSSTNIRSALSQAVAAIVKVNVDVVAKGYRASRLIGSSVTNDKNERIGTIDDLVIDKDKKQPMYAVLQVGGFLSLGGHLVAIQFDQLKINEDGTKIELLGANRQALESLNEFHYKS
jgi:sporulation protein YlmC with PRC-barrel domain